MERTSKKKTPASKTGSSRGTPEIKREAGQRAADVARLARLAHDHLGSPAAADQLARLVELIAAWTSSERVRLPPDSQKKALNSASAAAARLADRLAALPVDLLLQAVLVGDPDARDAEVGKQRLAGGDSSASRYEQLLGAIELPRQLKAWSAHLLPPQTASSRRRSSGRRN